MRQLKINNRITNRSSITVNAYISELSARKYDPLTADQETECAKKIKRGDKKALDKLINANLRFVVSVAKQYDNFSNVQLMDIINEGNVGIIEAAKRFDHTKGFKFITYAVWWIRQSIMNFLNDNSRTIRIPINKIQGLSKIESEIRSLEQILGRTPSKHEIEESFLMSDYAITHNLKNIDEYEKINQKTSSLDFNISSGDGDNMTLLDLLSNETEEPMIKNSLQIELDILMNILPKREKRILELYYGLNGNEEHSLEGIRDTREFDLTPERIRQIRVKAEKTIKQKAKNNNRIIQFLG